MQITVIVFAILYFKITAHSSNDTLTVVLPDDTLNTLQASDKYILQTEQCTKACKYNIMFFRQFYVERRGLFQDDSSSVHRTQELTK